MDDLSGDYDRCVYMILFYAKSIYFRDSVSGDWRYSEKWYNIVLGKGNRIRGKTITVFVSGRSTTERNNNNHNNTYYELLRILSPVHYV